MADRKISFDLTAEDQSHIETIMGGVDAEIIIDRLTARYRSGCLDSPDCGLKLHGEELRGEKPGEFITKVMITCDKPQCPDLSIIQELGNVIKSVTKPN
jgi:hypothetical protein